MKTANQPAPQTQQQSQETPAQSAPPSTSGAPKGPGSRVTTLSDLSQMMANGQLDATQYRNARRELNSKGFVNL